MGPTHLKRLWVSPIEDSPVTSCGDLAANTSPRGPLRSPLRTDLTSPTLVNHVRRFPSDMHSCCLHIPKSTGPKWQTVLLRRCLELACTLKSVSLVGQEDLRATSSQIPNTSGQPEHAPSLPNWEGLSLRGHHCHKEGLLLPWEK